MKVEVNAHVAAGARLPEAGADAVKFGKERRALRQKNR